MKKHLTTMLTIAVLIVGLTGIAKATVIIPSLQNGEVFDGQKGPLDGIGDAQYNEISSYFGPGYVTPQVGQAMAYFDLSPINGQNITHAFFKWDVGQTQGDGAPSSTGIYGMLNDLSLSLDDFNAGTFWGEIQTAGLTAGDSITLDITHYLQTFSGTSMGIRLASLDSNGNTFMNMKYRNATLTFETSAAPVPEPSTILLISTGIATFSRTVLKKRAENRAKKEAVHLGY